MTPTETLDHLVSLSRAAEAADGAAPLDEATLMLLEQHPDRVRVDVVEGGFTLVHDGELDLVVHPERRGQGIGRSLLERALPALGDAEARAWSHGNHPGAAALAAAYGFERERDLWVMRRPTALPLAPLPEHTDVRIRGYDPSDAEDLLRINAAAFAQHPEQGAMDTANLAARMAEPWFDPAGLLIAERDGVPVGFHWTKVHSPALGEVYVVGIDPAAQGGGLGKLLTLAGLHHLTDRGVAEVLLYVEAENRPAVAVYTGQGFTHAAADTHVQYRRPAAAGVDRSGR